MIKGVICDLDGFLVETWKTEPLDGVLEALAEIRHRGIRVAVATNQASPLWNAATGDEKFPDAQTVGVRLALCADALELRDALWCVALYDERAIVRLRERVAREIETEEREASQAPLSTPPEVAARVEEAVKQHLHTIYMGMMQAVYGRKPQLWMSTHPDWRKPGAGMLYSICARWSIGASDAIYGGDMDSDRQAADAAGMRFVERLSDVMTLLESEG